MLEAHRSEMSRPETLKDLKESIKEASRRFWSTCHGRPEGKDFVQENEDVFDALGDMIDADDWENAYGTVTDMQHQLDMSPAGDIQQIKDSFWQMQDLIHRRLNSEEKEA